MLYDIQHCKLCGREFFGRAQYCCSRHREYYNDMKRSMRLERLAEVLMERPVLFNCIWDDKLTEIGWIKRHEDGKRFVVTDIGIQGFIRMGFVNDATASIPDGLD